MLSFIRSIPFSSKNVVRLIAVTAVLLAAIGGLSHQVFAQPEAASAAIMAIEEKPSGAGGRAGGSIAQAQGQAGTAGKSGTGKSQSTAGKRTTSGVKNTGQRVAAPSADPGKYNGEIVGDKYSFLNFEIAEKVQPIWTIKAKNAGAKGLVQVEVYIDQNGNVLTARARTGNALLHPEAERAALATKFNKPRVNNRPVRALGFVVYRFGKAEDDDE